MNQSKLLIWSITVALAGFLFGFDTVVISGADQALQHLWNSSSLFHGWVVMASALWGTVIGALFGSIPTDKFGRKKTLIAIGILYVVGSLGSALVHDPYSFACFRFIDHCRTHLRYRNFSGGQTRPLGSDVSVQYRIRYSNCLSFQFYFLKP